MLYIYIYIYGSFRFKLSGSVIGEKIGCVGVHGVPWDRFGFQTVCLSFSRVVLFSLAPRGLPHDGNFV